MEAYRVSLPKGTIVKGAGWRRGNRHSLDLGQTGYQGGRRATRVAAGSLSVVASIDAMNALLRGNIEWSLALESRILPPTCRAHVGSWGIHCALKQTGLSVARIVAAQKFDVVSGSSTPLPIAGARRSGVIVWSMREYELA